LGIADFGVIVPDEDGSLNLERAILTLRWASGIFIGGGHTPTYHRLYATESIRSVIRERYEKGVPIAGMSAGALIAPEICVLPAEETGEAIPEVVAGLGLARGFVVEVHFSERKALPALLEAMARAGVKTGWGIDEPACAVFAGGRFERALGRVVYEVRLLDPETGHYKIFEHAAAYNGA
jgi:cyanophycinase